MTNNRPVIIAHRGYSAKYPDNTALAFRMAGEAHAGGAETDVRMTADGVAILNHNDDVDFADGTSLPVEGHTLEELRAKPLLNDESDDTVYLCTFREYLEILKAYGMIGFIELKGPFTTEQIRDVFRLAEEVYDLKKCILQSFDFENLLRTRELFPDLPIMLTYGDDEPEGYARCFAHGISLDACKTAVTPEMIGDFHAHGLEVGAWTVNDRDEMARLAAMGVDYIETDACL